MFEMTPRTNITVNLDQMFWGLDSCEGEISIFFPCAAEVSNPKYYGQSLIVSGHLSPCGRLIEKR